MNPIALGIPALKNSAAIKSRPMSRMVSFTRSIVISYLL